MTATTSPVQRDSAPSKMPALPVSVIVPVFNHWDLVPELLDCLQAQTLDQGSFEVLLVDNASDVLPSDLRLPSWARLMHCPTPGSYAARNAAVAAARGDTLAFTDADCRPMPDWLESGIACIEDTSHDAIIAGDIVIEPRDRSNVTPYELYDMALGMPQRRYVRRGYAVTANLFVPSRIMQRSGGFDATRFSGGDAEFCRRVVAAGAGLKFCPRATTRHPARREWDELVTKARRIKGGQIKAGARSRRLSYVFRTLMPPFRVWGMALRADRLSIGQRMTVCAIKARLWRVEMAEMLRLVLGKPPNRS
jgi:glycosyltransferase involved in cell wall biosynthesis